MWVLVSGVERCVLVNGTPGAAYNVAIQMLREGGGCLETVLRQKSWGDGGDCDISTLCIVCPFISR